MVQNVYIYTLSDSTGETVQGLSVAVGVQFVNVKHRDWTLIKTVAQLQKIAKEIEKNAVVLYTLVDKKLVFALKDICKLKKVLCLSPMDRIFTAVTFAGGVPSEKIIVGKQHIMNEQYFSRVEAMNFAIHQDDGQNIENILQSDVVIVGVSRTSKSPTCLYLANKGIRASNVPFVKDIPLPNILENIPKSGPLVVGLYRDVRSLLDIRLSRLRGLSLEMNNNYVNLKKIHEEMQAFKRTCTRNNWSMISVEKRSIEETASKIINYMENR